MDVELLCKRQRGMSGIGRYARSLVEHLPAVGVRPTVIHPRTPTLLRPAGWLGRRAGFDLSTFLQTFPLSAETNTGHTLKHLTSQEMGTWLTLHSSTNSIVTVHDIFPYTLDPDLAELHHPLERLFYRLAMHGLKNAKHLIADSDYTKRELMRALGIDKTRITVVPLGVDHATFRPTTTPSSPGLPEQFLLYVGSDAPRKNLPRLLEAFASVRAQFPDLWLVKVGALTSPAQAQLFTEQIAALNLANRILILTDVDADELVRCYSEAAAFVFPSLREGFGLPPLEAMACGTPVICSNATSLPEVVGDAALLVDGNNPDEIAAAIVQLLTDKSLAATLRERGLKRSQLFTWQATIEQTHRIYQRFKVD